jgi:hypothetical protein
LRIRKWAKKYKMNKNKLKRIMQLSTKISVGHQWKFSRNSPWHGRSCRNCGHNCISTVSSTNWHSRNGIGGLRAHPGHPGYIGGVHMVGRQSVRSRMNEHAQETKPAF